MGTTDSFNTEEPVTCGIDEIPAPVLSYLVEQLVTVHTPAALLVDQFGTLSQIYGGITHFLKVAPEPNTSVTKDLFMLEGVLPLEEGTLVISEVNLASGVIADLHLVKDGSSTWVIFLDASERALVRQKEMQERNELRLGKEDSKKLVEQLERANETLLDFALMIGHDLKAPLNGLKLVSQMLVEDYGDTLDEKAIRLFKMLENRTERMSQLVSAVLKYAAAGQKEDRKQKIVFMECTNEVVSRLTDVDYTTIKIEDHVPTFTCRKLFLEQILYNLISNAIVHNDKAHPEIVVRSEQGIREVRITVEDNGPGIDDIYHGEIFKVFYRLRPEVLEGNSGIGLAIAKKLVLKLGGELWIESKPGEGSKFCFTVPQ